MENNEPEEDDALLEILSASGFSIVPLQAIVDAMAQMEEYLKEESGLDQDELEEVLHQIENLIGKEEALKLDLEEILGWIRALKG